MNPKQNAARGKEISEIVIAALLLALVLRTFVIHAFKIPSGSMLPSLQIGDQILVSKFSYGIKLPFIMKTLIPIGVPERGDVVVFVYPQDRSKDYVKRVIGVSGDTIEIRNKQLFLNGRLCKDPYAKHYDPLIIPGSMHSRDNFGPITIPAGSIFVMGDNRDYSNDSRFWGTVDVQDVIGKALIVFFSWDSDRHAIRWNRIGKTI